MLSSSLECLYHRYKSTLNHLTSTNMKLNILFVCSMNRWRSPTAECIYKNHTKLNVRSAGLSPNAKRKISLNDLIWADLVFVMERKHKLRLNALFRETSNHPPIHILDIPDDFQFMDPELIIELKASCDPILEDHLDQTPDA